MGASEISQHEMLEAAISPESLLPVCLKPGPPQAGEGLLNFCQVKPAAER